MESFWVFRVGLFFLVKSISRIISRAFCQNSCNFSSLLNQGNYLNLIKRKWYYFWIFADYLFISWVTNCAYNHASLTCLLYGEISRQTLPWHNFEISHVKYLRNRKHVPCFYRVIQTRVEVWENEKCCGNTSRRRVFP